VADVANAKDKKYVEITGAIATTEPVVTSFNASKLACVWSIFVRDPSQPRGLQVWDYGDDAPENDRSKCPRSGGTILFDTKPGDILTIIGQTDSYGSSNCTPAKTWQRQIRPCSLVKTGNGAAPDPVVVSDLDGLAAGVADYQGLLVKIENVTVANQNGQALGNNGSMKLVGTGLEVHNSFFFYTHGQQVVDPGQTFSYIIGINHLDFCNWTVQPRNKCQDFSPPSKDCGP